MTTPIPTMPSIGVATAMTVPSRARMASVATPLTTAGSIISPLRWLASRMSRWTARIPASIVLTLIASTNDGPSDTTPREIMDRAVPTSATDTSKTSRGERSRPARARTSSPTERSDGTDSHACMIWMSRANRCPAGTTPSRTSCAIACSSVL